ncbi:MAG: response regulator [Candidatus Competibacteraceae bacterium]|nr:response regulator [Candidatus Competibacteraceae bacterium]
MPAQCCAKEGYDVIEASSGLDALESISRTSQEIDLLVTDVMMSGMNGRQLSDQLTALHPDLKVLFVSGYSHDLLSEQGVLDHNVTLLQKPYTPLMLQSKVHELLMI